MSLTPLQTVKEGVDAAGYSFDDAKLQRLTDAAEAHIAGYIRADLGAAYPGGLPADVEQAIIELVRVFYDGHDTDHMQDGLPAISRTLLSQHRRFS